MVGVDWFVKHGVSRQAAKNMVRTSKNSKGKVRAHINGPKLRVVGKKRDDLQSVIAMRKDGDFDVPLLAFNNFRDCREWLVAP